MKALEMSFEQSLKQMKKNREANRLEREKKELLYRQATDLKLHYPHLRNLPTKYLMWALSHFKLEELEKLAQNNLSLFLFRREITKMINKEGQK